MEDRPQIYLHCRFKVQTHTHKKHQSGDEIAEVEVEEEDDEDEDVGKEVKILRKILQSINEWLDGWMEERAIPERLHLYLYT